MKRASTPSTGSAMASKQRLIVQIIPTHIMTGLLLLSATMVAVIWQCHQNCLSRRIQTPSSAMPSFWRITRYA
ncbi:hypothetical protein F5Y17DRAFT_446706 [Xylariaceae sp. FL0594]|nr:hypothetical protein F5Y17DRAFT_446706 [Xylariaceae sp. FL0594]